MSARALRRLREDETILNINNNGEESEDEEYESEDDRPKRTPAFAFMMDDSSSSDEDDDDDSSDGEDGEGNNVNADGDGAGLLIDEHEHEEEKEIKSQKETKSQTKGEPKDDEEEDLDAILSEFQNNNNISTSTHGNSEDAKDMQSSTKHSVVLYNNDARDYDIENALRNMLHGTSATSTKNLSSTTTAGRTRRSKTNLFARQRDAWGKKPSSYIGGGLGMQMNWLQKEEESSSSTHIPWPYNDETIIPRNIQQWYTFQRSTTYSDRINDYNKYIANTGDINTLAMFIADNPFVVEPMFHFAMFFFSIGENDRGVELLKRILWVMECAAFSSFLYGHEHDKTVHLMDRNKDENDAFFSTLFRLAQTSCMVGCVATSLAVSRFLLSLDPLLDPCGILMVLDYYALATMQERDVQFLIDLVDSGVVQICDANGSDEGGQVCELREMPNWAFSYALALYRRSHSEDDNEKSEELQQHAEDALDYALARFPFIPRMLLEKNNVNLKSRSFQTDWPSVMGSLDDMTSSTNIGVDKIASVFVERNHKLWSGDDVLHWLYLGCQRLVKPTSGEDNGGEDKVAEEHIPSIALLRYREFDPMDFQDAFRRIPADANPLDPGLMDAALHYTPNRRRFLRMNRAQGGRGDDGGMDLDMVGRQQMQTLLGGGRNAMTVIDPDLPLFEVFWRSLLPWARVDGVAPPR